MNPACRVQPGSAVRGAGVALACLSPGLTGRARAVLASYVAGWPLGRPGLQVFVVVPDEDAEPWRRAVVPLATSGASWTALMLVAVSAVRRTVLPAPVAARRSRRRGGGRRLAAGRPRRAGEGQVRSPRGLCARRRGTGRRAELPGTATHLPPRALRIRCGAPHNEAVCTGRL